jgi:hypothetical protein
MNAVTNTVVAAKFASVAQAKSFARYVSVMDFDDRRRIRPPVSAKNILRGGEINLGRDLSALAIAGLSTVCLLV